MDLNFGITSMGTQSLNTNSAVTLTLCTACHIDWNLVNCCTIVQKIAFYKVHDLQSHSRSSQMAWFNSTTSNRWLAVTMLHSFQTITTDTVYVTARKLESPSDSIRQSKLNATYLSPLSSSLPPSTVPPSFPFSLVLKALGVLRMLPLLQWLADAHGF